MSSNMCERILIGPDIPSAVDTQGTRVPPISLSSRFGMIVNEDPVSISALYSRFEILTVTLGDLPLGSKCKWCSFDIASTGGICNAATKWVVSCPTHGG